MQNVSIPPSRYTTCTNISGILPTVASTRKPRSDSRSLTKNTQRPRCHQLAPCIRRRVPERMRNQDDQRTVVKTKQMGRPWVRDFVQDYKTRESGDREWTVSNGWACVRNVRCIHGRSVVSRIVRTSAVIAYHLCPFGICQIMCIS